MTTDASFQLDGGCDCRCIRFVRVGTPAMPEYHDRKQVWTAESLERRRVLQGR